MESRRVLADCCPVLAQQRACRAAYLLNLPDGVAAMLHTVKGVERPDAGQLGEVAAVQRRDAQGEVFHTLEWAAGCASRHELRGCGRLQRAGVVEAEAERKAIERFMLDNAVDVRDLNIHRTNPKAVALGVLDQHGRACRSPWAGC